MLAHYRRLIALRHDDPVVALGDFAMLLPEHPEVYAFTRSLDGEVLLVVCNVSRTTQPLAELLPESVRADLVLGTCRAATPRCCARGRPGSCACAEFAMRGMHLTEPRWSFSRTHRTDTVGADSRVPFS